MRIYATFVVIFALTLSTLAAAETPLPRDVMLRAASADSDEASLALFELAETSDAAGQYARALDLYRASVTRSPSNRYALRATARADQLAAHAEGNFEPFAKLERVRRDPKLANDAAALEALAHDADFFPPGLVRVEARLVVAEAYLGRLNRPRDGLALLDRILADPACDPLTRRHAARRAVEANLAAGDIDAAVAVAARGDTDPEVRALVAARVRRRWTHRASLAVLGALLAFALAAAFRARGRGREAWAALRKSIPASLLLATFVGAAGGGLASAYESGNARPFLAFAAASLPVLLVARAWSALASPSRALARVMRGALCAAAVAATGFLVLEYVNTDYLEGFGL